MVMPRPSNISTALLYVAVKDLLSERKQLMAIAEAADKIIIQTRYPDTGEFYSKEAKYLYSKLKEWKDTNDTTEAD